MILQKLLDTGFDPQLLSGLFTRTVHSLDRIDHRGTFARQTGRI